MNDIYKYILSITAAALICAIIKSFCTDKSYSGILSLICGVFMAVTIVSPLFHWQIPEINVYTAGIKSDAEDIVTHSQFTADSELRKIIKENLEAYVLDKATSMNVEVQVDIALAEDNPTPVSIVITGDVAPYNKSALMRFLKDNVGIPEESQIWK